MILFSLLGICCYGFAIIDFAGMFFGYDLTGVFWSPMAAGVIGSFFMKLGGLDEDESTGNEETDVGAVETNQDHQSLKENCS